MNTNVKSMQLAVPMNRDNPPPIEFAGGSGCSHTQQSKRFTNWVSVSRGSLWVFAMLVVVVVGASTLATVSASPVLLVDYKAVNYNATSGIWTDSSGNGNNATVPVTATAPTLMTNATPNGSSAVSFVINNPSEYLNITTGLAPGSGYTVLAFAEPTQALYISDNLVDGPSGAMTYRVSAQSGVNHQELANGATTFGSSNTVVPTTAFSMIGVATDNVGNATFYFNGSTDGTTTGNDAFTAPINLIGVGFIGNIAELQVYSGVLTTSQVQTVNQSFINSYVNSVPEPGALTMLALGTLGLLLIRRRTA